MLPSHNLDSVLYRTHQTWYQVLIHGTGTSFGCCGWGRSSIHDAIARWNRDMKSLETGVRPWALCHVSQGNREWYFFQQTKRYVQHNPETLLLKNWDVLLNLHLKFHLPTLHCHALLSIALLYITYSVYIYHWIWYYTFCIALLHYCHNMYIYLSLSFK